MTTTTATQPRTRGWFPAAPAIALVERLLADTSTSDLADQLGLDRRTVQRLTARRRLRSDAADRLAVAMGRHPCEIWPEWFGGTPS